MEQRNYIDIYRGEEFVHAAYPKKRDCYVKLKEYVEQEPAPMGKICALYGIRRTGKTVMMQQCIAEMPEKQKKQSVYILCKTGCDMYQLQFALNELIRQEGMKNIFIDEITELEDFQVYGNALSDGYPILGARIIVAGTDSLGIGLAEMNILYDRVEEIHTSHVSYAEFSRLLGGKSLDEYIEFGGTLTDSPYKTKQSRDQYLNSAIVNNILHSLEKNEEVRKHRTVLTELYDQDELVSVINKMINKFSYQITVKAIQKYFKSAPLYSTLNNMRNSDVIDGLAVEDVNRAVRKALHVKDREEMTTVLRENDLEELKFYLKELDLFLEIPCYRSWRHGGKENPLEIILQPGMVYAQATALTEILSKDEYWNVSCQIENQNEFKKRADHFVKGILLENILLSETYLWLQEVDAKEYYVSQLSVLLPEIKKTAEADMLILDQKHQEVHLFEIKHSDKIVEEQTRHLRNELFLNYIRENFGEVKSRSVIYLGGDQKVENPSGEISYWNAEKFLERVHKMHVEKKVDFAELLFAGTERKQNLSAKKKTTERKMSDRAPKL